tara:strand:+ start:24789 stop:26030 length:1242 start_codon:yes stop_codon:yes gene_type:complete
MEQLIKFCFSKKLTYLKKHDFLVDYVFNKNIKQKKLNILLLNTPCNGFGDLIFAVKLFSYLKEYYKNCNLKIATTFSEGLQKLGFSNKNIIKLDSGKRKQCRKFKNLKLKTSEHFDLILVAPLSFDFTPDINDVKKIIPYANWWNTYFFSEYNDAINKGFYFNTGIGKNRDGLFLIKPPVLKKPKINKPFALVYVAESIPNVERCIISFTSMVAKKNKFKKFIIIVPPWFSKLRIDKRIIKHVAKFYPHISIQDSKKERHITKDHNNSDPHLIFRCDILPVSNVEMLSLMKYSVRDILLTGDQSITDCLSCCSSKNIFYQIAEWKIDFAKELAKLMPNKYLSSVKTSCGTLDAISYKSNYNRFVKNWNFKKLGKPKLNAVIKAASLLKNPDVKELYDLIHKSRSIQSFKLKLL